MRRARAAVTGLGGRPGGLSTLWPPLCLPTLVFGLAFSLASSIREERKQAALLPFADDPEVVRRVARGTSKICRQVVCPLEESCEAAGPPLLA